MLVLADTLTHMVDTRETYRDVVGAIVRDEMAASGYRYRDTDRMSGVSKATLGNVSAGKVVSERTYRRIETALGFPRGFLSYVAAGDVPRIRALPGRDVDGHFGLREDVRAYTIAAIEDVRSRQTQTPRKRSSG